jgi:hypothetical protein
MFVYVDAELRAAIEAVAGKQFSILLEHGRVKAGNINQKSEYYKHVMNRLLISKNQSMSI